MNRTFRIVVTLLALGGASMTALAVQAGRFWVMADGRVELGPTFSKSCLEGACTRKGLDWVGAGESWQRAGTATYVTGLAAAFVMVMLAGAVAAGRRGTWSAGMTISATLALTLASLAFVVKLPDLPGTEIARGLWLLVAGVLAAFGAAATVLLKKPSAGVAATK